MDRQTERFLSHYMIGTVLSLIFGASTLVATGGSLSYPAAAFVAALVVLAGAALLSWTDLLGFVEIDFTDEPVSDRTAAFAGYLAAATTSPLIADLIAGLA